MRQWLCRLANQYKSAVIQLPFMEEFEEEMPFYKFLSD